MKRVVVESPFAGNWLGRWRHVRYARACIRDCLMRGESPLASHLLYTQRGILRDDDRDERALGIKAGHAWIAQAHSVVVYIDFGISSGMRHGIMEATAIGVPIAYRSLQRRV